MSEFSLEEDGLFQSDVQPYSDDPFSVLHKNLPPKSDVNVDQYSNISNDDFVIPCSQKRLPPRFVLFFIIFSVIVFCD